MEEASSVQGQIQFLLRLAIILQVPVEFALVEEAAWVLSDKLAHGLIGELDVEVDEADAAGGCRLLGTICQLGLFRQQGV